MTNIETTLKNHETVEKAVGIIVAKIFAAEPEKLVQCMLTKEPVFYSAECARHQFTGAVLDNDEFTTIGDALCRWGELVEWASCSSAETHNFIDGFNINTKGIDIKFYNIKVVNIDDLNVTVKFAMMAKKGA